MPDLLSASVEYSGYISIIKFVIFLIAFYSTLPLISWVYHDADSVGTRQAFWTSLVLGTAAAAAIIWLVVPVFIIGTLFYLIAVGAASLSYLMHRNTKVPDFERLLTAEHIKGLFVSEAKGLESLKGFIFVTANNNEVPVPEPRTPDFFGYRAACDTFGDAIWRRASDIVFSPTHQSYNVTYYVDGAALKQPAVPKDRMEYFIRFLKNLTDLDADEKRKPQKGRFRIRREKGDTEWEVATAGSTAGEQVQIKRITRQSMMRLADIGLPPDWYEQLNKIRDEKQGLFIVAGPERTGVITTFYALLRNHDPFIYNVKTLERQPSAELPNITQNTFSLSDTGTTTYAKKLQAVVTAAPDVVGVADCRDSETAQIASAAAKDGKIVYVTLQAESVIQALGNWIKLVGDRNLAAETLLGISNQRLLRKLCNKCKQAYEPNRELLRKFNIPPEKAKVLYRSGQGQTDKRGRPIICENCQGTGFVDRMCVFEIIAINDQLKDVIRQSKSLSEIGTQFRRAKMPYLQEQALKKVIEGTTAVNEMVRVLSKKQKTKRPEQST